jgi:hypothetical protein
MGLRRGASRRTAVEGEPPTNPSPTSRVVRRRARVADGRGQYGDGDRHRPLSRFLEVAEDLVER